MARAWKTSGSTSSSGLALSEVRSHPTETMQARVDKVGGARGPAIAICGRSTSCTAGASQQPVSMRNERAYNPECTCSRSVAVSAARPAILRRNAIAGSRRSTSRLIRRSSPHSDLPLRARRPGRDPTGERARLAVSRRHLRPCLVIRRYHETSPTRRGWGARWRGC